MGLVRGNDKPCRIVGVTRVMSENYASLIADLKSAIESRNLTKPQAILLRDELVKK